jgi:hypothetical protein
MDNRTADNWRPLFAIADECGGEWPERVREIARKAVKAAVEQSAKAQLLGDIRSIFDGGTEQLDRIGDNGRCIELFACYGYPCS